METWQNPYKKTGNDGNNLQKIVFILVAAGLFVASFLHMIFWGPYSFSILGLKFKSMVGSITTAELTQMADICYRRASTSCYIGSYQTILQRDPNDLPSMAALAKAFRRSKMIPNSVATYEMYRQRGGSDPQALYDYAKVAGDSGDVAKASEIFQSIIDSRPGILQVTVTQAYVEMLIKNNKPHEAKAILDSFHNRSPNAKSYLQTELKKLEEILRQEIGAGGIEKVTPPSQTGGSAAPSLEAKPTDLPTRKDPSPDTVTDESNEAPPVELPVEDTPPADVE